MRILFLSSWFPHPPDNGSKLRILNLLRQLAAEHSLTLLSLSPEPARDAASAGALRDCCQRLAVVREPPYAPSTPRALAGLFAGPPRALSSTYSREMERLLWRELERGYDLLIASELGTMLYALAAQGIPRLLDDAEVRLFEPGGPALARLRLGLTRLKLAHFLRRHATAFRAWTVVSHLERESLLALAPNLGPVWVIPNGVEAERYLGDYGPPEPDSLIYPGALTYGPNRDAMVYFLQEIFPRVRAARPAARLRITGPSDATAAARLPLGEGVELTGYLPDVRPALAQSAVCVCPLRHGAGSRIKVLESLALGTPVVATTKGAEGLAVTPGHDILLADEPGAFAEAVVEVLASPERRRALGARGRALVRERYDWGVIGPQVRTLAALAAGRAS